MFRSVKRNAAMAGVACEHAIGDAVQPRRAVRFQMRLPAIFRWTDEQGIVRQEGGFTRDISTAGLFVYASTPPPPDTVVELDVLILLPEQRQGTHLRGSGRVVRVEGKGEHAGFAAVTDFGMHTPITAVQ